MPIYEYQCQACGEVHEELQKIGDSPIKKCPDCGKLKLKKLISAPSFRLSGTGWYETDFKSDKDKQRNLSTKDSESEGQSKDQSKDNKKSDSKDSKNKKDKSGSDKGSGKTKNTKKNKSKTSSKSKES